ncbi:MAG: type III pantothenate kinase [Lentisphaeria bacterium]|nr:type III pantothenate kinase [Lentisphaeria bacterium]
MIQNLLIVNCGNTHIETCFLSVPRSERLFLPSFADGERKILTEKEFASFLDELPEDTIICGASVVPSLAELLSSKGAFLVNKEKKMPFGTEKMDISTVGADRLANAAALCNGPLPAICIDFGTAITFEVVEEDGSFTGGAILPGRKLMRHALHDHTALLPLIPLSGDISELPQEAGKNTFEAMLLGTDLASIGSVKEILHSLCKNLIKKYPGKKVRICACGGDRKFFLQAIPEMEDTPFLTMEGIYRFWRENES